MQFVTDGERSAGIELVERLLATGSDDGAELTPQVAAEAIEALEHLELPWLVGEMVESGERFAEQVHNEAVRGLQEVIQNAEDQGARNIRFGYRRRGGKPELLIAHDGSPVEVRDVVQMAWPLLSGSRADPDKIGRFGIGLKTLNQFGDRLGVHCLPLPGFEIRGGRIARVAHAAAVPKFWSPAARETLFVLRLEDPRFDLDFFRSWLVGWDSSSLLFLRDLERVTLFDLAKGRVLAERGLRAGKRRKLDLDLPGALDGEEVTLSDLGSRRSWVRYSIRYKRPESLKATHKKLGDTVRLQLAIPRHDESSRLYVGLPLEEPSTLPFALAAPFEPNVDRTRIRDQNRLNEWLIARLGDFAAAVAVERFSARPSLGWGAVALPGEGAGDSAWVSACFQQMVEKQRARVESKVRLTLPDGAVVRLSEFMYESEEFDGLFEAVDLERLQSESSMFSSGKRAVPPAWRDDGRWRAVLEATKGSYRLRDHAALAALDWSDAEIERRGLAWLVDLIHAGLNLGEHDVLWESRCVVLADGERLSPAEIEASGALLVHSLPTEGLAAILKLAQQVARPFRARTERAEVVRSWLRDRHVLREKATDADAVRALARGERLEPIDLGRRDALLVRLRNVLEQVPAEERDETAAGVGRNVAIRGYTFAGGKKVPGIVRPCDAYLPSAIDKNEGWPVAAAHTPGVRWVDTGYKDSLRGARGQGALVFLRLLGAATAPRLERASDPSDDPHATPLIRLPLCEQHRYELADMPRATGLAGDWVSPDLEAVVADLMKERKRPLRRRRARALFLALDRAWEDEYAAHATARAVRHYYSWDGFGDVSATWVARLASEPWLSTQESQFRAAAPRDLTILTEAAFEVEGENPDRYVAEIEAEHVDSPVVEALGIQGRPYASSILERIEAMRTAEQEGAVVEQAWANRSYQALSSYAPDGPFADRSDLTPRQIQQRFTDRRGGGGLVRVDGAWLPPRSVRRDPFLDAALPRVTGAEPLWDLLGVDPPSIDDCIDVMRQLAARDEPNPSSEIRVLRHLQTLEPWKRRARAALAAMPLRTYSGWVAKRKETVYAVSNPGLAEAVGAHWPVWQAPLPLEGLAELVPLLGVHHLGAGDFTPEIPANAAATSIELQTEFAHAVGHLSDYLTTYHPALHERLPVERWKELEQAQVIAGSGWRIRVRGLGKRSISLKTRAHLFTNPLRFCVLHEDELADHDAGGQAIAEFFLGDHPSPEHRSTLALAWAYAFARRSETRAHIEVEPDQPQDAPTPADFAGYRKRSRPGAKKRRTTAKQPSTQKDPPRELPSLDDLDLATVKASFLEAKRRGVLKASQKTKLGEPKPPSGDRKDTTQRAGDRHYSDRDREDLAYAIVDAVLSDTRHLNLEDTRDQPAVGADAVDREQDIWIELKAHGRDASDTLRLEPSEALRAEEKRGKYWLVVVWNLELPRTPEFVVIPDPLHRLDTYLASGLKLSGVQELAAANSEP